MSRLFSSEDRNTGASASASVLPKNIQGWFHLGLTSLISLLSKGLYGVFSSTTVRRHQFFGTLPSLWSSSRNPYVTTGKTIALTLQTFVSTVMSLLFNTLSRFVIAFLPRSKRLLISGLQSPFAVILEPKKRKFVVTSTFFPFYMPWSKGAGCHGVLRCSVVSDSCDPTDCSLPGSSVHGISQVRILEWVAISFSRRSSQPRGLNQHLLSFLHWQVDSLPLVPPGKPFSLSICHEVMGLDAMILVFVIFSFKLVLSL